LRESRTSGKRIGRNRITEPQFRSIGDKSVRADLRGVKDDRGVPVAQPQTDADAPDTTPDRVFKQSDPNVLNKMQSASASDKAQKTDLDAGPRKVGGGKDITDELVSTEGIKAGLNMSAPTRVNSVEVRVQPTAQAISIRNAREQDEQRRTEKRKASEQTPGRAVSQPGGRRDPSEDPTSALAGAESPARAGTDFSAIDAEIASLAQREQQALARVQAFDTDPRYANDPNLDYQQARQQAVEDAWMAAGRKQQLLGYKMTMQQNAERLGIDMQIANSKLQETKYAADKQLEAAQLQYPDRTSVAGIQDFKQTVPQLGIRGAAQFGTLRDMADAQTALPPEQAAQLQALNFRMAAATGLADALQKQTRLSAQHPLVSELADQAYQMSPNDPAARATLIREITNAATQTAMANGATFAGDDAAARIQQILTQYIEANIAARPKKTSWWGW
jgi:hypothetical protein